MHKNPAKAKLFLSIVGQFEEAAPYPGIGLSHAIQKTQRIGPDPVQPQQALIALVQLRRMASKGGLITAQLQYD